MHTERFLGVSPHAIFFALLDEGTYLASASTMFRALREIGVPRRRATRSRARRAGDARWPGDTRVEWRIAVRLQTAVVPYSLLLLTDAYSRYPDHWGLRARSVTSQPPLIRTTPPDGTSHDGRQPAEIAKPESWASMMAQLGVRRDAIVGSDAPVLATDNQGVTLDLSEPPFFSTPRQARSVLGRVWRWYAREYRHPDLGYYTPHDVHTGDWVHVWEKRAATLARAYAQHSERFAHQPPSPAPPPGLGPPGA